MKWSLSQRCEKFESRKNNERQKKNLTSSEMKIKAMRARLSNEFDVVTEEFGMIFLRTQPSSSSRHGSEASSRNFGGRNEQIMWNEWLRRVVEWINFIWKYPMDVNSFIHWLLNLTRAKKLYIFSFTYAHWCLAVGSSILRAFSSLTYPSQTHRTISTLKWSSSFVSLDLLDFRAGRVPAIMKIFTSLPFTSKNCN